MRILTIVLISAVALSLLLVAACTDRGANPKSEYLGDSGRLKADHIFFNEFAVQVKNRFQQAFIQAYTPLVSEWTFGVTYDPQVKMPLLVLLPPQEGDEFYYFNHGLTQVANELIEAGEIDPMIIVTMANDPTFGGFWWAGGQTVDTMPIYWAGGTGNYDALIGGTLIDYVWRSTTARGIDNYDTSQGMTGIGGIGTGAYGAFRAAMKHPGRFGSISAVDGPLDFDGWDGNGGLIPLFRTALESEQLLLGSSNYRDNWDTSGVYHISQLLTGGAMAFSPHDTLVKVTITPTVNGLTPDAPDSIIARIDTISSIPLETDTTWEQRRWKINGDTVSFTVSVDTTIDDGVVPPDTTITVDTVWQVGYTLVDHIVSQSDESFHFHLPFDENGQPYNTPDEPIWSLWLRNNLENIYQNEFASQGYDFSDTRVWFAISQDEDPRNFPEMTAAWANFVKNQTNPEEITRLRYSGTTENPAIADEYLNYLLREMLIFHDRAFKAARATAVGE